MKEGKVKVEDETKREKTEKNIDFGGFKILL